MHEPELDPQRFDSGTQSYDIGALPLLWPLIRSLGMAEIVDAHCPADRELEFTHGQIVEAMVACRLCNPVALYRVEDWARDSGAETFLAVPADKLNDDRLRRTLDAIYPHLYSIQGSLAVSLMTRFNVPLECVHFDPTHFLFYGEYADQKDAPDLLQVRAGRHARLHEGAKEAYVGLNMARDQDGAVPLFYVTGSGNENSCTLARSNLDKLLQYVRPKKLLVVQDRGCHCRENAFKIHDQHFQFITVESLRGPVQALLETVHPEEFTESRFLSVAERKKRELNKPRDTWEFYRVAERSTQWKHPQEDRALPVRIVFVYSSADEKTAQATRTKYTRQIRAGLEAIQKSVALRAAHTQPDAVAGRVKKLFGRKAAARYFSWTLTELTAAQRQALPEPTRGKRRPTHRFEFTCDEALARQDARWDGYWALATNVPAPEKTADEVFCHYKGQSHVDVSQHQMKAPLRLHPVFLHTQEHIESLVLIIFLALMVFYLVQRQYRAAMGPEDRTTGETLLRKFARVCLLVEHGRLRGAPLTREQNRIVLLLRLPPISQQIADNRHRARMHRTRGAPL